MLVEDNGPIHTSKLSRAALAARAHWLTVEWLPKYAPELNDIETVWRDLKAHHLAHMTFADSEYRRIGDPSRAALYRRSLGYYTEKSLLLSAFFYAMCSAFFLAIFLIKYRIELVFTFPLLSALFTWYLALGMKPESAAQAPEKLYREVGLLTFAAFVFLATIVLSFVDMPFLQHLMEPSFIHLHR